MKNKIYPFLISLAVLMVFYGCGGGENVSNRRPTIISPNEAVFPQTRTGTVYTIIGSDPDGDQLLYSTSGPDAASFLVDEITGELTFRVAPDVDAPGSIDGDNFYSIDVKAEDPFSASDTKRVIIEVTRHDNEENVPNRRPTLISSNEVVFPQTKTGTVYTIIGSDLDGDQLLYSISGPDTASFLVNEITGELTFRVAPDVDAPGSIDGDNFYFIDVTAKDPSSESDTQLVVIEVSRYDSYGPFLFSDGTVFIGPNTITESDPSILQSVNFKTTEIRTVADNRFPNDVQTEVHIFHAIYENGTQIEMVVNTQISPFTEAEFQAQFYANILGQLDPSLMEGIKTVFIHPGVAPFTGPMGMIIVHVGTAENDYIPRGVLEEVMAHEAVHVSIDPMYFGSNEWYQAQKSDIAFISQYARDFPEREDLAESYVAHLIVKNADRNSSSVVERIQNGIPERIQFFKSLGL